MHYALPELPRVHHTNVLLFPKSYADRCLRLKRAPSVHRSPPGNATSQDHCADTRIHGWATGITTFARKRREWGSQSAGTHENQTNRDLAICATHLLSPLLICKLLRGRLGGDHKQDQSGNQCFHKSPLTRSARARCTV